MGEIFFGSNNFYLSNQYPKLLVLQNGRVDMMETEWARSGAERGMKEETQRP
jgi:hypothetical protein